LNFNASKIQIFNIPKLLLRLDRAGAVVTIDAMGCQKKPAVSSISYDGEHGRIETCSLRATAAIAWLQERPSWQGFPSIIAVAAKREIGDKASEETRYFISSLII
jgi:predicted transposase YbfD/YdcC